MNSPPAVSRLAHQLTDAGISPNGARHNSIIAGLVYTDLGWRGVIRVIWNASYYEPAEEPEPTLKGHTVIQWQQDGLEDANAEVLLAAWWMGAWDVLRIWHQPLGAQADPFAPHHGLVSLFGPPENNIMAKSPSIFLDHETLIRTAARDGWVSWRFRPTLRSSRVGGRVAARDKTLAKDGTRINAYPYKLVAPIPGERSVITLGQEEVAQGDPWALERQGATLRFARKKLGISADALATRLRLGENGGRTVRRWEAGQVPVSGPAQVAIELLCGGILT